MTDADVFLNEWAYFFRDRWGRRGTCWSLEGKYRRLGDEINSGGWDEAPRQTVERNLLRALKTHDVICTLPKRSKWSVTYHYCYPTLEKWQVLMNLKRWLGYRVSWKEHEEAVEIGQHRVVAGHHTVLAIDK